MAVRRLNHAVLRVSDVRRAAAFWSDALGMETVAEMPQAVFLRLPSSGNHHDLGLFATPAPPSAAGGIGLYHLAWEVESFDDLEAIRARLVAMGALTGESDHGATLSLYGADPDGIELEVMWQLPRDAWGEVESQAVVRRLDWVDARARWSGRADQQDGPEQDGPEQDGSEQGGDLVE